MAEGEHNASLQTISQANAQFTFDMYKGLAEGTDNLFFSPISLQVILALLFIGGRGDTAKQIARGLRIPEEKNVTEDGFSDIMNQLQGNSGVLLSIANKIFLKNGFHIKEEFNNSVARFMAGTQGVDFLQEEQTREIINNWVENNTNQKIKNIITPGLLNELTQMVLVNAIYFKGDWLKEFSKNRTRTRPFHLASGSTQNVDMMYVRSRFKCSDISDLESQAVLLPYKEDGISMLIILPRARNGLSNLENKLTNINLQDILSGMQEKDAYVHLPKFKLEYNKELKATLKTLGMTDMFDPIAANFTGISDQQLVVSTALHKAFIEVNEEGTEAAAATALIGVARSAKSAKLFFIFNADHPFVFLILDQKTKTVLFAGRYSTPAS